MSEKDVDAARFVDAAAALVGIDVMPEQRPGVITNFENFRALHRRISAEGTPNPLDPIGLFRP